MLKGLTVDQRRELRGFDERKHYSWIVAIDGFMKKHELTTADIAAATENTEAWIKLHLELLKLEPSLADLLDRDYSFHSYAHILTKLPHKDQLEMMPEIEKCEHLADFSVVVAKRALELRTPKPGTPEYEEARRAALKKKWARLALELREMVLNPHTTVVSLIESLEESSK